MPANQISPVREEVLVYGCCSQFTLDGEYLPPPPPPPPPPSLFLPSLGHLPDTGLFLLLNPKHVPLSSLAESLLGKL